MKKCPICTEEIQNDAIKCRFCGEMLNKDIEHSMSKELSNNICGPNSNLSIYAGFWRRCAAICIDSVILAILGLTIGISCATIDIDTKETAQITKVIWNIIGIISSYLYFTLFESSSKQATPGKMALGIIVTDINGNKISFRQANGRYLGKLVSSITLCIGYFMVVFTQKKQALHDIMACTLVIKKTVNSLACNTVKTAFQMWGLSTLILFIYMLLRDRSAALTIFHMNPSDIPLLNIKLFLSNVVLLAAFILFYRVNRIKSLFYILTLSFFSYYAAIEILSYLWPDLIKNIFLLQTDYLIAKLWPTVMNSTLFWVAANQRFTTKEAAVVYPLITLFSFSISNLLHYLTSFYLYKISSFASFELTIPAVVCLTILAITYLLSFLFLPNENETNSVKENPINFCQKFIYIFLLGLIFVAADYVSQSLSFTLTSSAKEVFKNSFYFNTFFAQFSKIHTFAITIVGFLTCWMVWVFGWRISALFTPVISLGMIGLYWYTKINPQVFENLIHWNLQMTIDMPLLIIAISNFVFFGLLGGLVITTNQMAFIPLPTSTKARANALLATFFGGKITLGLLRSLGILTPTSVDSYPILFALLVWIVAVELLARRYKSLDMATTS